MSGAMRVGLTVAGALVLLLLLVSLLPGSTPEIDGENAIASLEPVEIGGVEQWLLLRGENANHPVLLFVHGGPGMTFTPMAHEFGDLLEEQFVVVHWDQRGAGKSCSRDVPDESLNVDRFVDDLIEVADHLRERFDEEKIFLVGHSWGSVIGAMAAHRAPDRFHVYVGSGQVIDMNRGESLSRAWVIERANQEGNDRALRELEGLVPPYEDTADLMRERRWVGHYGGDVRTGDAIPRLVRSLLTSPEYTLADVLGFYGCVMNSLDHVWTEFGDLNFIESIRGFDVPVRLFLGRHDWTVPTAPAVEWAGGLVAPSVEIVWFEDSAHMAMIEEPERYQAELTALRDLAR